MATPPRRRSCGQTADLLGRQRAAHALLKPPLMVKAGLFKQLEGLSNNRAVPLAHTLEETRACSPEQSIPDAQRITTMLYQKCGNRPHPEPAICRTRHCATVLSTRLCPSGARRCPFDARHAAAWSSRPAKQSEAAWYAHSAAASRGHAAQRGFIAGSDALSGWPLNMTSCNFSCATCGKSCYRDLFRMSTLAVEILLVTALRLCQPTHRLAPDTRAADVVTGALSASWR